jgi:SH3-like domain-containing protein
LACRIGRRLSLCAKSSRVIRASPRNVPRFLRLKQFEVEALIGDTLVAAGQLVLNTV